MATAAQIEANRRNAQKSTGPRTERGKDRSRMNALVHGLRASVVTREQDNGLRRMFREQLEEDFRPGSVMEVMVLDRLVETMLRLRLIPEVYERLLLEREGVTDGQRMAWDMRNCRPYQLPLLKYERTLSRQSSQLLRDFRELRQDRLLWDAAQAAVMQAQAQASQASQAQASQASQGAGSGVPLGVSSQANVRNGRSNPILAQAVASLGLTSWMKGPVGGKGEGLDLGNRPDGEGKAGRRR